jgi:hypothetical protein
MVNLIECETLASGPSCVARSCFALAQDALGRVHVALTRKNYDGEKPRARVMVPQVEGRMLLHPDDSQARIEYVDGLLPGPEFASTTLVSVGACIWLCQRGGGRVNLLSGVEQTELPISQPMHLCTDAEGSTLYFANYVGSWRQVSIQNDGQLIEQLPVICVCVCECVRVRVRLHVNTSSLLLCNTARLYMRFCRCMLPSICVAFDCAVGHTTL